LAYRKDTNIKNHLVRATLKESPTTPTLIGTFPCSRNRCKTCKHTSNSSILKAPSAAFHIKQHFTCTDTGVVYAIVCRKCGDIYIGETERKLAERFREHLNLASKQDITKSTVAQHYNLPNHSYTDMEVMGLLHVSNTNFRKIREKQLIQKLGTLIPLGLNTMGENRF
jgi:hypothetical protein